MSPIADREAVRGCRARIGGVARLGAWLVCVVSLSGHALAGQPVGPVRDLHYGEALFYFYQQDEFASLTRLLAAQYSGRIVHHQADADLLLGGLYLSYGQTDQATRIFARLLAEPAEPSVHDRVWHYIGKAHYQRGSFPEAEAAFARVGGDLPDFLRAENRMLRAQNLMAQSRYDEVIGLLESERSDETWQAYARFNLGVALIRLGRHAEGARQLDRVGRLESGQAELDALRDKANLALGFAYLQERQGESARNVLGRVRLDGLHANKALLGFGWADALQEDYRAALTPWLELGERDLLDSAVQEALLAIPYAYDRIGAHGSAAEEYVGAMTAFDREFTNLAATIQRAKSGQLIPALLALDERGIGHWNWQLDELPDNDDARYLFHLIANHRFQDGLRSYRDLVSLREHLAEWLTKLSAFESMVDTRIRGYAQRLPAIESRLAEVDPAGLAERYERLVTTLAAIEAERDIGGLADATESDQLARLTALETSPAWPTADAAEARHKQRILKGLVQWQLDRDFAYRLWSQRRAVDEIGRQLEEVAGREDRTQFIRADMPLRLEEFRLRIAALKPRIETLTGRIDVVLSGQRRQLEQVVVQELETRQQRLSSYRLQARFALATIYDRHGVRSADVQEASP